MTCTRFTLPVQSALRGEKNIAATALSFLNDPLREYITSDYVKIELLPKCTFHSSDSMKNFLRAACVAICKVYQTGRKPMRGRHRVLRGGLQGIIAFSRSAFILRFHMCMALYSIFPWRGIAGFGASGRKGLFATRIATLGLVDAKSDTTVSTILYSTVFQRRCVRSKPRSLCCRDSSRARLSPSIVGRPEYATSRRNRSRFLIVFA